ncbi:FAD-binding and (Fe-S)-binding domain-containing protein [Ornithinimicrobium sufpigmenti]|uniref:FAD-binding and (Fe-S)-binding domain-containing protein n=1 Tax=Ornithinimicrobium sufpigmenti TaxID=2508882 RepID=UPI0010360F7A|nr:MULTISPECIES: FAD-binding and (Fe-S)-binding domain-containing protein [unclassified Ornithinimicrobium]
MTVVEPSTEPRDRTDRLLARLGRLGPDVATDRPLERHALAHDASHYLLVPKLVVRPRSTEEVAAVLRACAGEGMPLTFRSGGTSLSGQAVTEHVLADTRLHFARDVEVLDDGARVRVAPGVTVRQVNARLAPYRTKLGPDPASEGACTIGGVVANNSSGMHCGTEFNTYQTLDSLVVVLASGTVLDTGAKDAGERLRMQEPALHEGLLRLRDRVRGSTESVATLRRLFSLKNTMGYGLNSFLDHDDPVSILEHLMVGSEGTLGFIASATFRTVPVRPRVATGLLVFDTVGAATGSVPQIVEAGAVTAELLDAASLRVSALAPGAPAQITGLRVDEHAALLVEWHADTTEELTEATGTAQRVLDALPLTAPAVLTGEAAERAALWTVRKALYSAVAGARPTGTNALLEDIAVPVDVLGATCVDLTAMFDRHGYEESVIFGHAKDGNVHFMLNERFTDPLALQRYAEFTEDMVELVLARGGTLKAEHGTGRIMAPFVERQYGPELYAVMRELKALFDPAGLLGPGTILGDDPQAHLKDLKTAPVVEEEVDRCVECGFCEPVCPSRELTLTPRQRIVLRREMAAAVEHGDHGLAASLEDDYDYPGLQTCAVDGMCMTACPVQINTGDLVRRLRAEGARAVGQQGWAAAARAWGPASRVAGLGLSVADRLPGPVGETATGLARRLLPHDVVPAYDRELPGGGPARPTLDDPAPEAVLFAACVGSMFGPEEGSPGATAALVRLAGRAGAALRTPTGLAGLCCGTPWKSKGMTQGYAVMAARVLPALWEASDRGRLPVVGDAASCTEGLALMVAHAAEHGHPECAGITVVDAVEWAATALLPRLPQPRRVPRVVLHPTCGTQLLGVTAYLEQLAASVADEVVVPTAWGCCGMAGDRGLLHPELTASATAPQVAELSDRGLLAAHPQETVFLSANRTCEIAMTRASGRTYRHVLEALEAATR